MVLKRNETIGTAYLVVILRVYYTTNPLGFALESQSNLRVSKLAL